MDCLPLLAAPLKIVTPSIVVASRAKPYLLVLLFLLAATFDKKLPVLVRDSLHGLLCTWSVFLHLVMVESFLIPANKRLGD